MVFSNTGFYSLEVLSVRSHFSPYIRTKIGDSTDDDVTLGTTLSNYLIIILFTPVDFIFRENSTEKRTRLSLFFNLLVTTESIQYAPWWRKRPNCLHERFWAFWRFSGCFSVTCVSQNIDFQNSNRHERPQLLVTN